MNPYNFGQDFEYKFAVFNDKSGSYKSLAAVTDTPAIYIYDHKPTRENASSGADSPVATITDWANDTETTGKKITIPAITDPEPNNEWKVHEYWIAINYVLVNGGDSFLDLRLIKLSRPKTTGAPFSAQTSVLQEIFSKVGSYASASDQATKIALARKLVAAEFEGNGFDWCELYEPQDLNLAISYRALAELFSTSKFIGTEEIGELADRFRDNSDKLIKYLKLLFTTKQNGQPNTSEGNQMVTGAIRFIR